MKKDLLGQSIGRYHILEQLGEGGMATVYKAFDTRLEREVAVKVIRTEQFTPASLGLVLKRFEREAKALARLNHPNIVGVIDYGEHQGVPYLVMVYQPGGTLRQRLGNPMPPGQQAGTGWDEAVRLLLPVARALQYAHSEGIVHRDVKPSNILITRSGEPMLTDFGIAKLLETGDAQTLTGTGVGIGTPEYMAPEQGLGRGVDARADVYSLGIVLYELITGRKPYTADTPMAVVLKHVTDPLPRPTGFTPGLPDALEKLLLKALAKQPEDRYASMAEMAAALEALLEARHGPAPEKAWAAAPAPPPSADPQATRDDLTPPPLPKRAQVQSPRPPAYKPTPAAATPWRIPAWGWGLGGLALLAFCALAAVGLYNLGAASLAPTETVSPTAAATQTPIPANTATPVTGIRPKDDMVMVFVPAGPFEMGSNDGDSDEKPVHTVTLDGFWMDQTEVTNAMFAAFLNEMGNQSEDGVTWLDEAGEDVRIEKSGSAWQPMGGYGDHPVVEVNWYGAEAYCEWAGGRLPTEAEWEKAARGGLEGKKYPWGDEAPTCQAGARNGTQYGACDGRTVPVGTFQPNGYGLYDMAGNIWEWVSDWYDANYYSNSPSSNPTGPASGGFRVLRGGTWYGSGGSIRSANRNGVTPDYTNSNIGFRCLRSP